MLIWRNNDNYSRTMGGSGLARWVKYDIIKQLKAKICSCRCTKVRCWSVCKQGHRKQGGPGRPATHKLDTHWCPFIISRTSPFYEKSKRGLVKSLYSPCRRGTISYLVNIKFWRRGSGSRDQWFIKPLVGVASRASAERMVVNLCKCIRPHPWLAAPPLSCGA